MTAGVLRLAPADPGESSPHVAPIAASPRRASIALAHAAATHVLTGAPASDAAPPLPPRVRLVRAILWECARPSLATGVADPLLEVAGAFNPFSTRERADMLWKAVRSAPCASSITANDLRWIALYEAVGARDPKRMASLGAELFEDAAAIDAMRHYALMAAATGRIADGDAPAARRLFQSAEARLPRRLRQDAPMRLLALLAA